MYGKERKVLGTPEPYTKVPFIGTFPACFLGVPKWLLYTRTLFTDFRLGLSERGSGEAVTLRAEELWSSVLDVYS